MQPGLDEEIDTLGSRLSIEIKCPVHYPAYNKNMYECRCGVLFPLYMVQCKDWNLIRKKHEDEKEMMKRMLT